MTQAVSKVDMEKLVSLCKRRGFIFQSSEIYGGLGSCWDYGPLGVELKRNVKAAWWRSMVQEREDVVGLDASILMHPQTWVASGHVQGFADPLVECKTCHLRYRPDDHPDAGTVNISPSGFEYTQPIKEGHDYAVFEFTIHAADESVVLDSVQLGSGYRPYKDPVQVNPVSAKGAALIPHVALRSGHNNYWITFELSPDQPLGGLGGKEKLTMDFGRNGGRPFWRTTFIVDLATHNVSPLTSSPLICPACGGELTQPRMFNLMFKTFMGPVEDEANIVYLRPETAQGIFVNFQNVLTSSRRKLPFGIAQMGKAFRNEITPGNFIFRTREFEQMELEFFVKPGTDEKWFKYWLEERLDWYLRLGIKKENLRLRQHGKEELAHYARDCHDIEYLFPMGWAELEGIASRGDFDLRQHSQHSGKELSYFAEETVGHIVPFVIEPSAGVDRSLLAFLLDAYAEEPDQDEIRVVLHLHYELSPIKVAVLPLSRRENLVSRAKEVYANLRGSFMTQYDDAQSIGRRYRRQDEIGTPFCVTIDFLSLEDHQVTIRERDSMKQLRVSIAELKEVLAAKLRGERFDTRPLWTSR